MKKNILLIIFLTLTLKLAANELSWVDDQIKAIKPPRKGITKEQIALLKDPFVFLGAKKEEKVKAKKVAKRKKIHRKIYRKHYEVRLKLEATMNKSALINGKWYKEGSKVYSYKLTKVNAKTVLLTKGKRTKTLSILSKNKNLKIKNN